MGEVKKNLAIHAFIEKVRWHQIAKKLCREADIRIWKTVKSQGKVMEKSGNFEGNPAVMKNPNHTDWLELLLYYL